MVAPSMSDGPSPASLHEEQRSSASLPGVRARNAEVSSAIATAPLKKGALFASFAGHAGMLLALVLLALWAAAPPPERVLKVMLLNDGPGAAGTAGGNGGGGPAAAPSNVASAITSKTPTRAAAESASPASPLAMSTPTPEKAVPTPPRHDQTLPVSMPAASPEEPLPMPPPRKPRPPRRARAAPALPAPAATPAPNPAPAPPQLAAVPAPAPRSGEPGVGSGPGGTSGVGAGNAGAGHGAIGSGPIEGPGDDYLDRLRRWLNRYKHYPEAAQKAKQQGHLIVSFIILRDGTVIDPRIEQSSGFPLLDEAALKMLHDASPVPPLPDRYRAVRLGVDLPVDFSLGLLHRLF
jgi:protein TonB